MRWSVYKVTQRGHGAVEVEPLGYVNADAAPYALKRAAGRWPRKLDKSAVQGGFSVAPYTTDPHSLGRDYVSDGHR